MLVQTEKLCRIRLLYNFSIFRNHYEILGVAEEAPFKQIKEQYLLKSKRLHPDISPDTRQQYHQVQQAYKTLISPQHRKKYDLTIGIRQSMWERELNLGQFSQAFQSKMYDEILNRDTIKVTVQHSSVEQQLQQRFKQQIDSFQYKKLWKSPSFYGVLLCIGLFWAIWNSLELFLMNYQGSNRHKVQQSKTDKTFKSLPTFTR